MLRSAIFAALALSPAALLAATPQTAAQTQGYHSNLVAATPAAAPSNGSTTTTVPVRVFSGIVAPKLIHSTDVATTLDWEWSVAGPSRTAVVGMTVDETGKPTNLKIVQSAGPDLDASLLEAVSKYRFQPGTVSHQPSAIDVNLKVEVLNPYTE